MKNESRLVKTVLYWLQRASLLSVFVLVLVCTLSIGFYAPYDGIPWTSLESPSPGPLRLTAHRVCTKSSKYFFSDLVWPKLEWKAQTLGSASEIEISLPQGYIELIDSLLSVINSSSYCSRTWRRMGRPAELELRCKFCWISKLKTGFCVRWPRLVLRGAVFLAPDVRCWSWSLVSRSQTRLPCSSSSFPL